MTKFWVNAENVNMLRFSYINQEITTKISFGSWDIVARNV